MATTPAGAIETHWYRCLGPAGRCAGLDQRASTQMSYKAWHQTAGANPRYR